MNMTLLKALSFATLFITIGAQFGHAVSGEEKGKKHSDGLYYCQGQRFEPCICAYNVPKAFKYRPSRKECGGALS